MAANNVINQAFLTFASRQAELVVGLEAVHWPAGRAKPVRAGR